MTEQDDGPGPLSMGGGWGLLVLSVILAAGGIAVFLIGLPKHVDLVRLQWTGSGLAARSLVKGRTDAFRNGLWSDLALIVGLPAGAAVACALGRRVFWTRGPLRWALIGYFAAALAALSNFIQDLLLYLPLRSHPITGVWIFRFAEAASFIKFSTYLVLAPVALAAVATTARRLVTHRWVRERWTNALNQPSMPEGTIIPPPPIEGVQGTAQLANRKPSEQWGLQRTRALDRSIDDAWWTDRSSPPTHFTQDGQWPNGRAGETAICLSGGGIRSGSVALGALQAMRAADPSLLGKVDRIVSVSGGGYTNGALQLALTPPPAEAGLPGAAVPGAAAAADVFAPGSPEEDHLRRHSSYLSDGLGQWLVALGVILRNLLASLLVIGLTTATAGLAIAAFYRDVPLVRGGLKTLRTRFSAPATFKAPGFPDVPWGVRLGIGAAIAVFVLLYLVELMVWSHRGSRPAGMARISAIGGLAIVVVAVVGVGLPALVWVSSWLTWHGISSAPAAAGAGATAALSYLGTLAAALWRKEQKVSTMVAGAEKAVSGVLPTSMVQRIVIWLTLLVLLASSLILASWVATSGVDRSWWALAIVLPLAFLAIVLDQTAMSLHPFYRRRLASAFAVRRQEGPKGIPVAVPYSYDELTRLSTYGSKRDGWPQVTFAASANLTGQSRTPAGRRSVSYTFGSDYVGGPQVGWVNTNFLEALVSPVVARDLTVEAAVAISGAAFASAMGSQAHAYEVFLALTNARLGAWLPNPRFVALKAAHLDDWTVPGLPRIRGLVYFAREIFGIHSDQSRMLLCTDGGHYENLGLVETLRHRYPLIYCFDASGASDPRADTLAGAMRLAREELGVRIDLDDPDDLVAGSAPPLPPEAAFASLNARLAIANVITGTVRYPALGDIPEARGKLIFAQAKLTAGLPYEVLEYTQDDPGFPNDSTADQWFDCDRFDSYTALGTYLGTGAAALP